VRRGRVYIPRHRWIADLLASGAEPEIIELDAVSVDVWEEAEQFWIGYLRFLGCDLLNATAGGDGLRSYKHRADTRERQRLAALKRYEREDERQRTGDAVRKGYGRPEARQNLRNGRAHTSAETRAKMSRIMKEQRGTPEYRAIMSARMKGRVLSEEHRAKLSNALTGRKMSAEFCANQSARMRGNRPSAETKAKMVIANKAALARKRQAGSVGNKLTAAKVLEIRRMRESGASVKSIAGRFGIDKSTVSHICLGNIWKWVTEG
jgi:hypothetical protein